MEATDNTAESGIAQLNQVLDEYDNQLKLKFKVDNNIEEYLGLSADDLSKLSADHCGEMAASIALYSCHLQKEQNRQSAIVRWCESMIDRTNGKNLNQYKTDKYTKFEEVKLLAMLGNSYTSKLNDLRIKASSRLSEVFGMSTKIDLYIKTLLELQQSRRKTRQ